MGIYEQIEAALTSTDHADLVDAIEAIMDGSSVLAVLSALQDVAYGKAAHLRENWQDIEAARNWERVGNHLSQSISDASYC